MVPDMNPKLVQLMLGHVARSAAVRRADHEGHQGGASKPQAGLLQEYAELVTFIRDACIDRTQLRAILGLNRETLTAGDDTAHPPVQ
jgi:hypothetical protein